MNAAVTKCLLLIALFGGLPGTVAAQQPAAPELRLHVVRGIEFVADHELSAQRLDKLALHVLSVRRQVSDELAVPVEGPAPRFYLFADQRDFAWYVRKHIPSVQWSDTIGRHGLFLLRRGNAYVFLIDGEELVPSLRHECVHVLLDPAHPGLPVWLDEGLAQCYENPDGTHGNARASDVLTGDLLMRSPPSAAALARLSTMSQLGPREYAGAWAHAQQLLGDPEHGLPQLRSYLAALRNGEEPPDLTAEIARGGRRK